MPADGADLCRRVLHARGRPCARRASASGRLVGTGTRAAAPADAVVFRRRRDAAHAAGRCRAPRRRLRLRTRFPDARAPHQGRRPGRGEPRNHPHAPQPLYGLSAFPVARGAGRRPARRRRGCRRAGQQPLLRQRRRRHPHERRGTGPLRNTPYGSVRGQR